MSAGMVSESVKTPEAQSRFAGRPVKSVLDVRSHDVALLTIPEITTAPPPDGNVGGVADNSPIAGSADVPKPPTATVALVEVEIGPRCAVRSTE